MGILGVIFFEILIQTRINIYPHSGKLLGVDMREKILGQESYAVLDYQKYCYFRLFGILLILQPEFTK